MNGQHYNNTSNDRSDDAMWEPKQSFHALSPHGRPPLPLKKRPIRSFHPSHDTTNSAGLLLKKPSEKKIGVLTTITIPSTTSPTPVTPDTDMTMHHVGSKKNKDDGLVGVKSVPQGLQPAVDLAQDSDADSWSDDDDSSDEGDFEVIESGTSIPPPVALDLDPKVWDGSFTFLDCLQKKKQLWHLEDFLAAEVKHQTMPPSSTAEDSFLPPNFMWSAL